MSLESWFWKPEPCSPPSGPDSPVEWSLHEYDVEDTPDIPDSTAVVPSRADLAQQLLDDIEEYVKKEEEPYTDWFEEKVNLPIFDELQTEPMVVPPPTSPTVNTILSFENLQTLPQVSVKGDQEIAYILGHGHLTPPQSPPAVESSVPLSPIYIIQQPSYVSLQPPTAPVYVAEPFIDDQQSSDLEIEMAVVDEVVRGAAQQWEQWESSDTSSRSSDGTEDSDDPEWMPLDVPTKSTGRRTRQPRPYNVSDRRVRKKEQNKNAATRYRQKKKIEVNVIVEEERGLEDQNTAFKTKLTDIEREITYLKGLMRDVFRAKGLVQ